MLCALLLACSPLALGHRAGETVVLSDKSLSIVLPELESFARQEGAGKNPMGDWVGQRGGSRIRIRLNLMPIAEYDFFDPEDVVETWRSALLDPESTRDEDKDHRFVFGKIRAIPAAAGATPILAVLRGTVAKKTEPQAHGLVMFAGGLLADDGWSLRVDAWPAPSEEETARLATWLESCATYSGKPRDPKWTDAEALAYWKRYAPESALKKFEKPVRTAHFIFLTNSTSPNLYVKLIESRYDAVRKILPFEDLPGRRLLPVVLFRTHDDFEAFYRHRYKLESKDDVSDAGIAFDEVYITSCDRGSEFGHGLDVSKQVLISRQRGWGGCLWFRSGIREYASNKPKDRLDGLRAVKKGKHTPLAKLLDDRSWGDQSEKYDRKGTSDEANYWEQSAMWMEFLREGPWPKDAFGRLVDTIGSMPNGDLPGLTTAVETIYGTDLMTLEKKWVEYFKKR